MTAVKEQTRGADTQKRLADKVAIVTGGSRGIGAAIALRLAAEGASVVVNYANNKGAADEIVAKVKELGVKAIAVQGNVAKEEDGKRLVEETTKAFGKIDILVNNAGVFEMGPIDQIDINQYDRVFDVNVRGVIATTIAALPHLNDGGRIISISSGVSRATLAGASVYSATKAALDTLTRIWAQDLGKRHITVNNVAPGTTSTDMLNGGLPPEAQKVMIGKTPLGRLGEPEDIANVVAFLASQDGGWVTGQTIGADGGLTI
ncbi:MAG TPA: glucose 1-dehydrogenase [Oculatellaceae cyanobacterium]